MPDANPRIWVWMAALAVLLQTSELLITMDGAEAVGGVLSVTTVLESAADRIEGTKATKKTTRDSFKNLANHESVVAGRIKSTEYSKRKTATIPQNIKTIKQSVDHFKFSRTTASNLLGAEPPPRPFRLCAWNL